MQISSKAQMYELLTCGAFGNRFRIWKTESEFLAAINNGYDWLVGLRCVGQPGLPYIHHITPEQALSLAPSLRKAHNCDVRFYEASPDQFITIQGEISDYPHGYAVEWSHQKTHMRAALATHRLSDFSPRIPAIIRHHFNEPSLDDLLDIFRLFPGCTVEFTCYEIILGQLSGRNTIIWEARHY